MNVHRLQQMSRSVLALFCAPHLLICKPISNIAYMLNVTVKKKSTSDGLYHKTAAMILTKIVCLLALGVEPQ